MEADFEYGRNDCPSIVAIVIVAWFLHGAWVVLTILFWCSFFG
jgi:hypothetical protein